MPPCQPCPHKLSWAPQWEPQAVYIFLRCHIGDQKVPTPNVSDRKTNSSHLAACQLSHEKGRDLPMSWCPCWQGQQSSKCDPLTHQGKPWDRISKTLLWFFFFRHLGGEVGNRGCALNPKPSISMPSNDKVIRVNRNVRRRKSENINRRSKRWLSYSQLVSAVKLTET